MPSRKALIVGVSQYDESTSLPPLDAPFGDADAVYKILKQYGNFDLPPILLRREDNRKGWVSTEELEKALDTLFTKEDAEEVELAVFYFSGHGSYDSKSQTSYLAASDNAQAVSLRHLLDRVENSHFKNVCIWLDSCHSGGALEFKELKSKNYCVVAAASKFGYALIGKTGHSFLTELLCQALTLCKESTPTVTTFELVRYLKAQRRTLPPLQHVLFLHGERHFPLTFCDHDLPDNGQISRDVCPFKGLEAFTQNDTNFFYGRKRITGDYLDRLEEKNNKRLIPIVGASGSGKSSLVLAGILPNLLADEWEVQVIQPAGGCPLQNLPVQIPTDKKFLLVIDQFEQVFTQCHDEADKTAFKHLLSMTLQPDNRLYVLLTLRLDFLDRFTKFAQDAHPEIGEYLRRIEFLPSLNADELHQAITEPLAQVGMSIENSLVNELSAESLDEKGSLPLLQYTLEKLWLEAKQTGNDRLTWDLYRQLGGQQGEGLRGILNQKADAFYNSLNAEQQHLLEWLMVELTQPSEGQEDTRRTAPLDELHHRQPQYKDALDALLVQLVTQERLLTQDVDNERLATVTVAHEALIRDWQRLRDWLKSNREIKSWRTRLEDSITAWKNKVSGSLLREKRLTEAQQILVKYPDSLLIGQDERAFIAASQSEAKRRKQLWVGSLVAFIIVLVVGIIAITLQRQESEQQRQVADKQRLEANRQTNIALAGKLDNQSLLSMSSPSLVNGYIAQGLLLAVQAFRLDTHPPHVQSALYDGLQTAGHLQKIWHGHQSTVRAVAFSSNGKHVVSASEDDTLRQWDTETGLPIGKPWRGHENGTEITAFSFDGKYVVSAKLDNTLQLWDTATKQVIGKPWYGNEWSVTAVAISPDGSYVVSGGYDRTLKGSMRLLDTATGKTIGELWSGHKNGITAVAFSPNDRYVVSGGYDKTLRLWDVTTGQAVGKPWSGHESSVNAIAFSSDGKHVISAGEDKTLRLWDTATGQAIGKPWLGHEDGVTAVAFSSDNRYVVSGSWDKTLRLWDVATGRAIEKPWLGHEDGVTAVAFSPDGKQVISGGRDNTLRLWGVITRPMLGEPWYGHQDGVITLAFSPDGKQVISGGRDNTLRLWNAATGQSVGTSWLGHEDEINAVAFSPDSKRVISGGRDKTLRLWDVETGQSIGNPWFGHKGVITAVAFSPNGVYVVSASDDTAIRLWDVATGQAVGNPWFGAPFAVNAVAFSPDNKYVVSAGSDVDVRLWDVATGEAIGVPWLGHNDVINTVKFSSDGRRVISGSKDKTLRLWDTATAQAIGVPWRGHESSVYAAAFSPDNKYVVSTGEDKTLRLWDATTGQAIGMPWLGHERFVNALAFSPDGKHIVSGSDDKTLRLWDAAPESWAKKACSIVNRNFSLAEWQHFIGDALPYEKTCPDLPAPGEEGWVEPDAGG
jgi:WD40 repeat protein